MATLTIEEVILLRLSEAEGQLAEIEDQRKQLLWKIAEYRNLLGQRNEKPQNPVVKEETRPNTQISRVSTACAYPNMTAMQIITTILRDGGEPMKVADLAQVAIDGGYRGRDGKADNVLPNFSSLISRTVKEPDSPIIRLSRGLVGLADRDAQYFDPAFGPR